MEQLEHRNDIEIKLLPNRRFIYANRRQNIVITAENKATDITVLFPEEYENYSKRVDFVNSEGKEWTEALYIPEYKEYPPEFDKCRLRFTLPTEVTTEGELKMQFLAYKPDDSLTTVPFEIIPIDVLSGVLAFKKKARANPDLLILSYNRSTEALFKAQQAKSVSQRAAENSADASETSTEAKVIAENALSAAQEAKNTSQSAEEKADAAGSVASAAGQNSIQALAAANTANDKSDNAAAAAGQALQDINDALNTARTAEGNSQSAMQAASQAAAQANAAVATADGAKGLAETAESNSTQAVTLSAQAKTIAQNADSKANDAVAAADGAVGKADLAKSAADYAKNKAEYAAGRADESVDIATEVSATAVQAKAKAEQAYQTATTAQNLITVALTDAGNALSVATGIDAKAESALTRSQEALGAAESAEMKSDNAARTAEDALSLIQSASIDAGEALTRVAQAETQANAAYGIAASAQEATENACSKADGAVTTAASAASDALNAVSQAEAAEQSASQALTVAQGAEQTANEAKNTAEAASGGLQQFCDLTETALGDKVDKVTGKGLSAEDYTSAEKTKLAEIAANANNYTHPPEHSPSIIAQDTNNRFMTDAERAKLTGVETGAQVNTVTSVAGKTGAVVLTKSDVELGNVDNTSDANKPVSSAQQAALDGKVDKVTGKGLSSEDYTAADKAKLSGIAAGAQVNTVTSVAGKTGAVTLSKTDVELANVDNISDANKPVSTAAQTALNAKVDKVSGKGLSTEDYTTADKNKLDGIATGAQANTVTSVAGKTGAVTLAKGDIGLGSVDNTADSAKVVASASKLTTARTISLAGAVTGSVSFDGSGNASITTSVGTIAANSITVTANANFGNATTLQGVLNYIANVFAGTQKVTKIRAGTLDVDA